MTLLEKDIDLDVEFLRDINDLRGEEILDIFSGRKDGDSYTIFLTKSKKLLMLGIGYGDDIDDTELMHLGKSVFLNTLVRNKTLQSVMGKHGIINYKKLQKYIHDLSKEEEKKYKESVEKRERQQLAELKAKYERG